MKSKYPKCRYRCVLICKWCNNDSLAVKSLSACMSGKRNFFLRLTRAEWLNYSSDVVWQLIRQTLMLPSPSPGFNDLWCNFRKFFFHRLRAMFTQLSCLTIRRLFIIHAIVKEPFPHGVSFYCNEYERWIREIARTRQEKRQHWRVLRPRRPAASPPT